MPSDKYWDDRVDEVRSKDPSDTAGSFCRYGLVPVGMRDDLIDEQNAEIKRLNKLVETLEKNNG
jgi:hypothetical protein